MADDRETVLNGARQLLDAMDTLRAMSMVCSINPASMTGQQRRDDVARLVLNILEARRHVHCIRKPEVEAQCRAANTDTATIGGQHAMSHVDAVPMLADKVLRTIGQVIDPNYQIEEPWRFTVEQLAENCELVAAFSLGTLRGLDGDKATIDLVKEFERAEGGKAINKGGRPPSGKIASRRAEVLQLFRDGTTKPQAIADCMGSDVTAATVSQDLKVLRASGKIME